MLLFFPVLTWNPSVSPVFSSVFYLLSDDIMRPEHDLVICTMATDHSPEDPDDDKDQLAILPGLFFLKEKSPSREAWALFQISFIAPLQRAISKNVLIGTLT